MSRNVSTWISLDLMFVSYLVNDIEVERINYNTYVFIIIIILLLTNNHIICKIILMT